jgi:hypothetical protein
MKNRYLIKLGEYFFIALLAISVLLTIIFYINSSKINSDDPALKQISDLGSILDIFFYWAYLLAALAVILAIGLPLINIISNPKSGLKTLISVAIIAVMLFVAYQFADGTVMDIAGYKGPDNIPSRLKFTDMGIFSMYAMIVAAIGVVLYAEISKLFK